MKVKIRAGNSRRHNLVLGFRLSKAATTPRGSSSHIPLQLNIVHTYLNSELDNARNNTPLPVHIVFPSKLPYPLKRHQMPIARLQTPQKLFIQPPQPRSLSPRHAIQFFHHLGR
jgi:hypothetical protein